MRDRERGLAGVIDTLSAGYLTINRHPRILAIPVLLDMFYWLGPHLSLAPLVQRSLGRLPVPAGLPPDALQSYEEYRAGLLQASEGFNLFALLASHFPGIPSLMASREGLSPATGINDPWAALGLFILLPLLGLALAALYYQAVGRPVRGVEESSAEAWSRVLRSWWRLVALLLLVIGAGMAAGVPVAFLAFVLGSINSSFLGFAGSMLLVGALWIQFYLFFVVDAIVISDVGPVKAMRNSISVVKYRLGSAVALIGITWIITLGMPVIWDALSTSQPGAAIAIVGNAYISTGLAVASMIFYRDRSAALRPGGRG